MEQKDIAHIIDTLVRLYGGKKIELIYETPFQLLCAVILSAQTTDKQVNRITPAFFLKVHSPQDVISMSIEEIESYLKYVNFFHNKSRYIQEAWLMLTEQYGGIIPDTLQEIQKLPWVGIKTAKVVLSVLYNLPYVGVDTHIHRVMNRLGIVETTTPEKTDALIESLLTIDQRMKIHHPCVLFGRYQCTARSPSCKTCQLKKWCKYYSHHFGVSKD